MDRTKVLQSPYGPVSVHKSGRARLVRFPKPEPKISPLVRVLGRMLMKDLAGQGIETDIPVNERAILDDSTPSPD